jgi:hypothetical protein
MSKKTKKSFTQFVTRPKANQGIQLTIPNTGGEKITIIGVDSDEFNKKNTELMKGVLGVDGSEMKESEIVQRAQDNRIELLAVCVKSWTFSEPCNEKNIKKMLIDAPAIASFIDKQVANRKHFMGKI